MGVTWKQASGILYENAQKKGIPITASFELTGRCNFQCKMCYLRRLPEDKEAMNQELTTQEWILLAEEARNLGVFFVTLTGGEIFLRSDFREIYEAFSNMGFHITLHTNGSLITKEVALWLSKMPPATVSITLYGGTPTTYEKITGHKEGFQQTINGIRALLEHHIHTEIKTTLIKGNAEDFDSMMHIAQDLGLKMGLVNYVGPKRDDVCSDPIANRLTPSETVYYEKCFQDYNYQLYLNYMNEKGLLPQGRNETSVKEDQCTDFSYNENSAFHCSAGSYACWFTWNGHMLACGLLSYPALKLFEKPLNEIWIEMKKICQSIPSCTECKTCEMKKFCMTCPARLYSETGSFEKKANYLCQTATERIKDANSEV